MTAGGPGQHKAQQSSTEHVAAFKLDRSNPDNHKYTTTCACWYPIDTGMFVTGSFDQEIKVSAAAYYLIGLKLPSC